MSPKFLAGVAEWLLPRIRTNIECLSCGWGWASANLAKFFSWIFPWPKTEIKFSLLVCRPLDLSSGLSNYSNIKILMSTQISVGMPCRAVIIYIWKRTISLKKSNTIFIDKELTQKDMDINLHYQMKTGLRSLKLHAYLKDFIPHLVCCLCTSRIKGIILETFP